MLTSGSSKRRPLRSTPPPLEKQFSERSRSRPKRGAANALRVAPHDLLPAERPPRRPTPPPVAATESPNVGSLAGVSLNRVTPYRAVEPSRQRLFTSDVCIFC